MRNDTQIGDEVKVPGALKGARGRRSERGVALILTIFGLLLLTGVAMAMMFSSDSETLISVNYRDKQVATYAAMSALQEARDRIHPVSGDLALAGDLPTATPDAGGKVLYIINPSNGENVAPWDPNNAYFDQELCQENMLGLAGTRGVSCQGAAAVPSANCSPVGAGGGGWCEYYDESANATSWNLANKLDYKWVRITLKEDWNTPAYVPSAALASGKQVCWDGNYQSQLPGGYTTQCQASPGNQVIGVNLTSAGSGYTSAPTITISGGGGSGATATAQIGPSSAGAIVSTTQASGGSGYTTAPTVSIASPDGTGATFQAVISGAPVTGVTVNNSGANYCYGSGAFPALNLSTNPPSNTQTAATATVNMASAGCIAYVTASASCPKAKNNSYAIGSSIPPGGGSGFAGTISFNSAGTVSSIAISSVGSGYTSSSGTLTVGNGANACDVPLNFTTGYQVSSVTVNTGGSYMSAPTASLGGSSPVQPAAPTLPTLGALWSGAASAVTAVNVLTPGSGYLQPSYVLIFTGGGGIGATYTAQTGATNVITGVSLTNGGSNYTSPPSVTISGGGGTGASATATIAAGGINQSMGRVYLLTSMAVTKTGAKSMAQMEAGVRPPFMFNLGGAITLAGPLPNFVSPNSSNFTVNGNDANSCGQTASAAKPAIGVYDSQSQTQVINDLGKPQNYTGAGSTPSVEDVYTAIGGASATPSALNGFVNNLESYATSPILTGNVSSLPATTTSSVTFVNGNLTLSGNPNGSGVLVVTGDLTFSGDFTWNGIVLVIGQGQVIHTGGGNGTFTGAIYVAQTEDASGALLPSLGNPTYYWNGGGTNSIQYDHCLADSLLQKYNGQPSTYPLQVLSTRTLEF
jgi:hypothetical protein